MHNRMLRRLTCLLVPACAALAHAQADAPSWRPDDLTGIARPSHQVTLTAPLDGVLDEILVSEGDDVTAGQTVARMDDGIQRAAVEVARLRAESTGEMRQAELSLAEAQILVDRYTQAYEKDAASDWEVRRAELQRDQAAARRDGLREQRQQARANLALELARLERHRINVPFDGRVVREAAEPGATLARGDSVLIIIALDPLEAELHLPAALYGQLQSGDKVTLEAGEPVNRDLTATVKITDPVIDPASRTFRCMFTIDNADKQMPAGFTVQLPWPQQ